MNGGKTGVAVDASPRHHESQQNQSLGDGWRNAGRSKRHFGLAALLLAAAGAVQAGEPDLLTFDRIAYELAVLDLVEHELELAEPRDGWPTPEPDPAKLPRFNPCQFVPPDEPTQLCQCPPMPPWGNCL